MYDGKATIGKSIQLCGTCDGYGYYKGKDLVDYHKGIYKYYKEECRTCKGAGRMLKEVTIKLTPYVEPEKLVEEE